MMLIIDKRDTMIRYETGTLRIERKDQKFQRIPITQLEQVVIIGNPTAETNVWRYLAEASVPVAMIASRGTPSTAFIHGSLATQLPFRRLQHKAAGDPKSALIQARYFLKMKCQSYALSVFTLESHYSPDDDALNGFIALNNSTLQKLNGTQSVSSLMGLEGQLAHAWFVLLAHSLPYHWKFAGRNRRPPRDPLNALLSLGYTLLSSEVHQLLIASGLDPSLGFLHQDSPGRESFVLDFVEIFRSGVDSFALQWLAQASLDESSFYYRGAEGCRLSKATRPKFYKAWSQQRYKWPRPVIENGPPESTKDWPCANLREIINGHIMQWREQLKYQDKQQ